MSPVLNVSPWHSSIPGVDPSLVFKASSAEQFTFSAVESTTSLRLKTGRSKTETSFCARIKGSLHRRQIIVRIISSRLVGKDYKKSLSK